MAVCEIWDVRGRLDHPIDYAENPEKTANPKYTEADLQALGDVMKYATNGDKTEKCPLPGKIDTKKHTKVE